MPVCQTCRRDVPQPPKPDAEPPKPRVRRGGCGRRKPWNERCIYWEASQGRPGAWAVRVRLNGKLNYLGRFESPREAKKARNRFWAEKLGPDWQAIVEAGGHCGSGLRR